MLNKSSQLLLCIILAICFIATAIITGTLAWQHLNQNTFSQLMGESNAQINIEFNLKEISIDLQKTENPISNTSFYLFSLDGKQIGGKYITDEEGKIKVALIKGEYYFEEITPSIGYTFDEIDGEKITKYPFIVEGKDGDTLTVEAYNRRLAGKLLVRKNIENIDDSLLTDSQLEQEFTFTITFSDSGTYSYIIDNEDEIDIKSGEKFTLKHGQTAIFNKIPVGVLYNITETEPEGYIVSSSGHRGHITEEEAIAVFTNTYDSSKVGNITITKEVTGENADLDKEFTFNITIGEKQETFTLKNKQNKTFYNIPISTEYTVTEEAEKDYISTIKEYKGQLNGNTTLPFVNIYDVNPENKYGDITITKEVIGEDIDEDKEFEFEIVFEGENAPENTTFKLKAEKSKTFENIPYGVSYTVTEINANEYIPLAETITGVIAGDQTNNIKFQNVVPTETVSEVELSVTKNLKGEYLETDKDKKFDFTLLIDEKEEQFTLKADETKSFNIPVGCNYEIRENDYYKEGYTQEILNGNGITDKNDISVTVTNTYIGEVKTIINGKKEWKYDEKNNEIKLPESITVQLKNDKLLVQEQKISPNKDNEWEYTFLVPKYDGEGNVINYSIEELAVQSFLPEYDKYNITNIYIEPIKVNFPAVEKIIKGEDAPRTKFEFILNGNNKSPMPDESENNKKILSLNTNGELEFGKITFTNPGTYSYTVSELNGGIKGWTYDNTLYTVTIIITENNYKLDSEIIIEKNSKIVDNVTFTNIYEQEVLGENTIISGEKIWKHGSNPTSKQPKSIIVKVYGNGELKVQKQVTKEDNWKYVFELPKFDNNGYEIEYQIDEADVKNYKKSTDGYDLINEFIPPQDTSGSNNSGDSQKPGSSSPTTGDNIEIWFILMVISAIMFRILFKINPKKGKH